MIGRYLGWQSVDVRTEDGNISKMSCMRKRDGVSSKAGEVGLLFSSQPDGRTGASGLYCSSRPPATMGAESVRVASRL